MIYLSIYLSRVLQIPPLWNSRDNVHRKTCLLTSIISTGASGGLKGDH